jgi:hypothetical protein
MCEKVVVEISTIQILPEFLSRAQEVDQGIVDRYREVLDLLPEIEVWQNPETGVICLLNGRHRLEANQAEKYREVVVTFFEGTYEDALVRSRVGNMAHGLSYTRQEWRQAIKDIVKIRHHRANAWIAREARCSPMTISRIRGELEKAGEVPWLEFLETENGQAIQRRAKEAEAKDLSPESTEALNDPSPDEPQDPAGEGAKLDDEVEQDEPGRHTDPERTEAYRPDDSGLLQERKMNDVPVNVTLKLGQLGEVLTAETGLWIDGNLEPIAVTLLITANPLKGLPQTAPHCDNCLIISQAVAKKLNLLFD